jgi:hypothetical protein
MLERILLIFALIGLLSAQSGSPSTTFSYDDMS